MVKIDHIRHEIALPDGVSANFSDSTLTVEGPNGSMSRDFHHSRVQLTQQNGSLVVEIELPRRKEKAIAGTWRAHIANMVHGVTEGFEYRMKAVYSHFPMALSVNSDNSEFTITNLLGEKVPRIAGLMYHKDGIEVKVEKKVHVVITGIDREKVGQTAAIIERACRITGRDRRVFQDGVYIVSKGGRR
jgi:large subunit ribosomal protein L6